MMRRLAESSQLDLQVLALYNIPDIYGLYSKFQCICIFSVGIAMRLYHTMRKGIANIKKLPNKRQRARRAQSIIPTS
jgi:hypothetical protein